MSSGQDDTERWSLPKKQKEGSSPCVCECTQRAFAKAAKETKINQRDKRKAVARGRTFAPVFFLKKKEREEKKKKAHTEMI